MLLNASKFILKSWRLTKVAESGFQGGGGWESRIEIYFKWTDSFELSQNLLNVAILYLVKSLLLKSD